MTTLPIRLTDIAGVDHLVTPPSPPPPPAVLLIEDFTDGVDAWGTDSMMGHRDGAACIDASGRFNEPPPELIREVDVSPSSTIRFSGQLKTTDLLPRFGSAGAGFRLEVLNASGDVIDVIDDLPRHLGDTADWIDIDKTIPLTNHAATLRIVAQVATKNASGTACFDNIALKEPSRQEDFLTLEQPREAQHPLTRFVTLDRVTRPALLSPGDTTWAMAVRIDQPTTLRMSLGVLAGADENAEICFRVREEGLQTGLLQRCGPPSMFEAWSDQAVSLPASDEARTLLLSVTTTAGDTLAAWGDPRLVQQEASERMNVVLVVIDTLRADHLNVEGYNIRETSPLLDAFANRSVRFANTQATSGWTAPSLGSVVTGQLPEVHRAGRRRVRTWQPDSVQESSANAKRTNYLQLAQGHVVLAEVLRSEGYETIGFSTNNFFGPRIGFHRGFSRYQMIMGNNIEGLKRVSDDVQEWLGQRQADRSVDPFFLTIHVIDPHHPYRMRAPYLDDFPIPTSFSVTEEEMGGVEATVLRAHSQASRDSPDEVMVLYDAEIRYVDKVLGPLLDKLERDDVSIVVLSDHGEAFGEHQYFIHGNNLYQELLDVPLWIRHPDQPPRVTTAPVSLADVFPTILSITDTAIPDGLVGQVLPLDREPPADRVLISEGMYTGDMKVAARMGDWKYIRHMPAAATESNRRMYTTSKEKLFNLATDPSEAQNLAEETPDITAQLRDAVDVHLSASVRGLHLRCSSAEDLTIALDEAIGQIEFLESSGGLAWIRPSREALSVDIKGATHMVLQTLAVPERVTISSKTDEWVGIPPASVSPATLSSCQIWAVSGEDMAGEMSEEEAEELRALGYLE
jgi:arylsulfatase